MKRSTKIACILAAVLIGAGVICASVGFVFMDFDFFTLNTTETVKNTHLIDDAFTSIAVDTSDCDVNLIPAEGDACRVECIEAENRMHQVAVKNGTLCITEIDTRHWYDHIGFGLFKQLEINLYLPVAVYESLSVHTNTGDLSVTAGSFSDLKAETDTGDVEITTGAYKTLEVTTHTGDIRLEHAVVGVELSLDTDTGSIHLNLCDVSSARAETNTGNVTISAGAVCSFVIETDTGDVNLKNLTANGLSVTCNTGAISLTEVDVKSNVILETDTGDISLTSCNAFTISALTDTGDVELEACFPTNLSVTTDTGDVALSYCDGKYITVKTQTGDVEGVLLSGKIFDCKSDTGDVRVPTNGSDGTCTVTSDTGDIEINVQPKERNS